MAARPLSHYFSGALQQMDIGIFGLPQSGKSMLFSLLTGVSVAGGQRTEASVGVARVYDECVAQLSAIFKPKKTTYAALTFIDLPSYDLQASRKEKNRILQLIQDADALLAVVRAFEDESVPWPSMSAAGPSADTPAKQLETIKAELLIRDMEVVETRLARLEESERKHKISKDEEAELATLRLIQPALADERLVSQLGLSEAQMKAVGSLALFTAKPIIVAVNVDEEQLLSGDYPGRAALEASCGAIGSPWIILSGKIEAEIAALPEDERGPFMEELGIGEPGIQRLAALVYAHVGLISFLTAGEDEVRAWTIRRGTSAKGAAGKIHTDLEKHFIRAEIIPYDVFMQTKDLTQARRLGQIKSAGKDEVVQDGDIVTILANA
jgi:hypothetical protein